MDVTPTQSALLELKEERVGMQEGYRFLDEKRLVLASEILAELGRYEAEMAEFRSDYERAAAALRAAVGRHGLEELTLYPPAPPLDGRMRLDARSVLGVTVYDLSCEVDEPEPPSDTTVVASPEAARCRDAFRALIPRAAHLAALAGNLARLRADYARTARRARALEDVLLPEIDEALGGIQSALEELEREEAVRARRVGPSGPESDRKGAGDWPGARAGL
jgi:V/A-type H+-transporting ATPase subunit D